MKKTVIILMLVVGILLSACMQEPEVVSPQDKPGEMTLTQLEGKYELTDDRTYDAWTFTVPAAQLNAGMNPVERMTLEIGTVQYLLRPNRFKKDQYFCLLPGELEEAAIRKGKIKTGYIPSSSEARDGEAITFYSFYIIKEPGENGTTLYEILYADYMEMKAAGHPFLKDDNDNLIRPSYLKTTEGYVYTKQTFYDARQLADPHTTAGAFTHLKALANHEDYLVNQNPNRVRIVNNALVVDGPDTRDKVRELGTDGVIANHAYSVTDNSTDSRIELSINKANIDQDKYGAGTMFFIAIRGATECELMEEGNTGIFELNIPYATTSSVDLIKNARFHGDSKFAGGKGTEADPFQIENWEHLANIVDFMDCFFIQNNDLNSATAYYETYASLQANSGAGWNPIGGRPGVFRGSYDGNGYTIDNLTINRPEENVIGLFGVIGDNSTLTNMSLTNATVTGNQQVGMLLGSNYGGTISLSNASGTATGMDNFVGGLVGYNSSGEITQSYAGGVVITHGNNAGGLAGYNDENGTISKSYSLASASGTYMVGGVTGTNKGTINQVYGTGELRAQSESPFKWGGIAAYNDETITESYWNKETTGVTVSENVDPSYGKTSSEMQKKATFVDWDIRTTAEVGDTVWIIEEDASYPYLRTNEQIAHPAP